jgi:hypothetical protein
MQNFVKIFVVPLLKNRKWTRVCEIGASFGGSTDLLAAIPNVSLTVVDPCLDCSLDQKYISNRQITLKRGISLEVLPTLDEPYDCIIIDGDHNWYTVYHELKVISERNLLKRGGIIFFHDIGWPWGRRDMYYQPELIPPEYRQKMDKKGIVPGKSELSDSGGLLLGVPRATHEGGSRNGVLTAIEDFLREHSAEYDFLQIPDEFGLGIMHRHKSFIDDLPFLAVEGKVLAYNTCTWPKRFTRNHFPSAFSTVRSMLKRA